MTRAGVRMRVVGRVAFCIVWTMLGGVRAARAAGPTVVLNEVHYHPADDSRGDEFIEIHNYGAEPVDLGFWRLSGAVQYLFPEGEVIEAGAYLVIAADRDEFLARRGLDPALVLPGSFEGTLENNGELLRLRTSVGFMASFVDYDDSDLWPESADGLGPSLELVSPFLEEADAAAWEASIPVGGTPGARNSVAKDLAGVPSGERLELIRLGEDWSFFRGTEAPPPAWNELDFDDSDWESGPSGFGYGDGDDATVLGDMENNYVSVFIRKEFGLESLDRLDSLQLVIDFDDGFIAYLNGVEIGRRNMVDAAFNATANPDREAGNPIVVTVGNPAGILIEGTNVLCIQGHNGTIDSSDLSLAPSLEAFLRPEVVDPPDEEPEWLRPPRDLVINELAIGGRGNGWIELFNPTAAEVDAAGRHIQVYPALFGDYTLAAGSLVPPGGYLVVDEATLGFELDAIHASLLTTAEGWYIDGLNPRTVDEGHSTGRFPDGSENRVVFVSPSRAARNVQNDDPPVVINEILYHPARDREGTEFIELLNRSTEPVELNGWAFTRGIEYPFGEGDSIPPGGYLVLAADPAAVEAAYEIAGVLGPYVGRLNNDAETLVLRDALRNTVDRVRYADEGSWPEEPDGEGPSVELIHADLENRYGVAWRASAGFGTPGAPNSTHENDPEPIVVDVSHAPVIPTDAENVHVLATASDESGILSVTLSYEVDNGPGPFEVEMRDDGLADDGVASNGVYGAEIPAQADRSIVAFWIRALAVGDQERTVPAGAPRPAFLYQVENDRPEDLRPYYRVVMRAADLSNLRNRNRNSDVLLDTTFVADGRAYYNRGIRYRGSSARSCDPLSYRIQFDHDRDFHGIKRLNINGCATFRQWIGLDYLRRTGIPTPRCWFRRLVLNGVAEDDFHLRVEAIDDSFLARDFAGDADGNLYRGVSQANLDYRGEGFGSYRGDYVKHSNTREDDYSDVVDLCRRFDPDLTDDESFPDVLEERVDVDQWARYFAAFAILGSTENSILLNNGDDYFLYHGFTTDRWVLLPWDLDSCFDDESQRLFRPSVAAVERFLQHPLYAARYWCHLDSLLHDSFESDLVDSRIDHLVPLFADAQIRTLRNFAVARRNFIEARIQRDLVLEGISGAFLCGDVLLLESANVDLSGRAPACGTVAVMVNGEAASYDPVETSWSARVRLDDWPSLQITALDRDGVVVDSIELRVASSPGVSREARHEQAEGEEHLGFFAVDYTDIVDPNSDGETWELVSGADGALRDDGSVLGAPNRGPIRELGQSEVVYELSFASAGTYRTYFRARGFGQSTDSFWRSSAFGVEPDVQLNTPRNGNFTWLNDGDIEVTELGSVLEYRLGVREYQTQIDAIVFSKDPALDAATLDGLVRSIDHSGGPRVAILASPSTSLQLEGGRATVVLDGSSSHNGDCGGGNFDFQWEKIAGPDSDTFLGDPTASSIEVEFAEPGTYVYRLTVTDLDDPEVDPGSGEISIEVLAGAGPEFIRGDCDGDGLFEGTITDAVFYLVFNFLGGERPSCMAACDANGDGLVEGQVSDAVHMLMYNFLGGPPPVAPFPGCGPLQNPRDVELGCELGSAPCR